jgi:hypothetical protein
MWERIALGTVLSVGATGLVGIALNFTPSGITLAGMAFGLGLVTFLFLVLAVDARLKVPVADRPHFALGATPDPERPAGRTGPVMAALLAVSFAGMLLAVVVLFPYKANEDAYTNLYALGDGAKTVCLPDTYTPGANGTAGTFSIHVARDIDCPATASGQFTVGIVNHEGRVVRYNVQVFWSAPTLEPKDSPPAAGVLAFDAELGPIKVPEGRTPFERQFERNVTLTPPPLPELNRLNVQLYKDTGKGLASEPDLFLYFYVKAPKAE